VFGRAVAGAELRPTPVQNPEQLSRHSLYGVPLRVARLSSRKTITCAVACMRYRLAIRVNSS
jgi:hypothetical protein